MFVIRWYARFALSGFRDAAAADFKVFFEDTLCFARLYVQQLRYHF